jgi:hypothetical protein
MSCHHCEDNICQIVEHPDHKNEYFCTKCKRRFREEGSVNWLFFVAFSLLMLLIGVNVLQPASDEPIQPSTETLRDF